MFSEQDIDDLKLLLLRFLHWLIQFIITGCYQSSSSCYHY